MAPGEMVKAAQETAGRVWIDGEMKGGKKKRRNIHLLEPNESDIKQRREAKTGKQHTITTLTLFWLSCKTFPTAGT